MSTRWTVGGCIAGLCLSAVLLRAEGPYTIAFASFAPLNTAIFVADADGAHERMLVKGAAMDANPSFSPDGQWVVFTSRRNGSADIYRVRVDGTGLERLTDYPGFDDQAVMAPDGRRVAFVSSRSGDADVWLLDLQTREVRNLTADRGGDYRPAWSPDGGWLAFTSDRDSPGSRAHTGARFAPLQLTQIYVMRADGTDLRRLTSGDTVVGGASWSPDGTAIAAFEAPKGDWHVMTRPFPSGGVVASQISRIDVATGTRTALTSGRGRKLTPQWLADGRIAYLASDTEERPGQNYRAGDYWSEGIRFTDGHVGPTGIFAAPRLSRDGRRMVFHRTIEEGPPRVTPAFSLDPQFRLVRTGTFPSFSPDGRRLVCSNGSLRVGGTGRQPPTGDLAAETRLFVMNVDGSDRRLLVADAEVGALAPVWSPAGDRIAFGMGLVQPRPGFFAPAALVTIRPDGSGRRQLTPDDGGNYHFPSWSPDGRRLVFRSAHPESKGLKILEVETGKLTTLTADDGADNLPSWSPDGQWIAFTSRRDGDWDIYVIRPDGTGLKRLTTSDGNDAHAAWSSDSRWLAFGSARGGFKDEMARGGGGQGATDIFVMRADGSDVRRLTDDAAEEGTPAFAPR